MKIKMALLKFSTLIASVALTVTAMNANVTCLFLIHQPTMPEGYKQLKRF